MRYTRYFDWKHDTEYGDGWIMRGMPNFDPLGALACAHDVLEHLIAKDDSMEGEMRAFGVMLWGRGQGEWFAMQNTNHRRWVDNISDDLIEFMNTHFLRGQQLGTPPVRGYKLLDEDIEESLLEAFRVTLRAAREDAGHRMDSEDEIAAFRIHTSEFMRRALPWMRIGFRHAERRYSHTNPDEFSWMFDQLIQAFARESASAEYGEYLRCTVDTKTMRFDLRRLMPGGRAF